MSLTAEYLSQHPFASPDIIDPPEAPVYRYRPDINDRATLAALETVLLGEGSRVDIIETGLLESWVLQSGDPTGADNEVVPDDYDLVTNNVFWLLILTSGSGDFTGTLSFGDISGQLGIDQLPPGTIATLDDPGQDAFYFFDEDTGLAQLVIVPDARATILTGLAFGEIGGTLAFDQLPPGTVATLESIGEDAVYFYDDSTSTPLLVGHDDFVTWLGGGGGGGSTFLETRVARVDASGNDGTGTVGDLGKPFLTVQAALDAIDSADPGGGFYYVVDIGNNSFAENLTTPLRQVSFVGVGLAGAGSYAFSTLTYTADNAVNLNLTDCACGTIDASAGVSTQIQIELQNCYIGGVTCSGPVNVFGTSISWDSVSGNIVAAGYAYLAQVSLGGDVTAGGDITIFGGPSIGTLSAPGFNIFLSPPGELFTDNATGVYSGLPTIDSAGSEVWATGTLIASVVACGTLHLKDARVVGSNAATSTVYSDTLLAGDDTPYNATSWNGDTRTPTKNAIRDKFETLVIGTDVQAHDADLDTLAGLTPTTDNFIVSVSSAWASRTPSQVRTTLGLVVGTNVQAFDADLDALAALTGTNTIYYRSAANTWSAVTIGSNLTFSGGTLSASAPGTGDVVGPSASVDAELVLFNSTTGKLIKRATGSGLVKATSGVYSNVTDNSTNWDTAYTERHQWDGGSTNLVAATGRASLALVIGTNVQAWDADLDTLAGLTATTDNFIVSVSSAWASRTPAQVRTTLGLVIGTDVQAYDADLTTIAGLTPTTDNFIVSVASAWASRTPAQVLSTLAAVGTTFQPLDSDLTTIAGLTATTDNFIVSVSSAWASRTPAQVKTTLGLVIGTNVQAWDADLDTLAGLTATTDNFIVSVSSAWASRTPAQVRTTLGLVIGTDVQAYDADLTTIAGLTATTDNFMVSVSSAWASRTPSQVRTTLGLVIGTDVQAYDADLTTWAGITPASGIGTFLGTPTIANFASAVTTALGTFIGIQTLTASSGTYTPTSGTKTIVLLMIGGGGGGGGSAGSASSGYADGGGGSGGWLLKVVTGISGTYSYTVGPLGGGGASSGATGTAGTDTTFVNGGTTYTAKGGSGGNTMTAGTVASHVAGGAGGTVSTNGDVNSGGAPGMPGIRGSGTATSGGSGGSSPFGGGGFGASQAAGGAATGYGSGGAGASAQTNASRAGGDGAPGIILVYEYR